MTYSNETIKFLKTFSNKYSYEYIVESLDKLKDLKVLIIGDGIIDEYHYCTPMGQAAKSPIIVNKYISHEVFVGGAFIIANHISGLCDKVHLVTLLGNEDSKEEFIVNKLNPNIISKFFYRNDGPTILKKRYIEPHRKIKLFEINYLNNNYINPSCESKINKYLKSTIPNYDIVLVSDFGHGLITKKLIKTIKLFSKTVCVNTQTNAANSGYNMITKYSKPNFVCLDERESRLALQNKFGTMHKVIKQLSKKLNADCVIITQGQQGSLSIKDNEIISTPIFSTNVVDTVGAGDAFFAFTAPCYACDMPLDLISFIGNAVGALAVQIVGNKRPVEKNELLDFINSILME